VQESFGREVASQRMDNELTQSGMSCVLLSRETTPARMLFGREVFVVRGLDVCSGNQEMDGVVSILTLAGCDAVRRGSGLVSGYSRGLLSRLIWRK
jgi:hypothetical protein